MAFSAPALLVVIIIQLNWNIQVSEACSVVCPSGETICTCPNGKPEPTPDANGLVISDSCGGLINYCSKGKQCKPEENGCPTECCFRFGWGSRMVPCCLSTISCDEHDRLTAENQGAKQMPGGGWGKASVCPKDAAGAHQLWQQADQQPITDCPQICTLDYSPVCGSDGKTYSNNCALEVASCKTRNQDLTVDYQGECMECQEFCTFEYSPVCGTDGETYSSKCSLTSKACREKSELAIAYAGECKKECQPFCTLDFAPVCGSDGQTHPNLCSLETKACRERSGLTVARKGACGADDILGGPTLLGPGSLPPAWSQIENTDQCLKQYKPTTPQDALHYEVCVPLSRPEECPQPTWWELGTTLDSLPPEEVVSATPPPYLTIEGVNDCLENYQFEGSSHTEKCLPMQRPKDFCNPDAWDRLVVVWEGFICPEDEVVDDQRQIIVGENQNAHTPRYLEVIGWQRCLMEYQAGSYTRTCVPSYKPLLCSKSAWSELKSLGLVRCPPKPRIIVSAKAAPPAYLSIEGHETCIDSYSNGQYSVRCLPETRPDQCSTIVWDRVRDTFNGLPCPAESETTNQLGGVPPAYLSVDGFRDCLDIFNASSSHSEHCLPAARPFKCKAESWNKLKHEGFFKGVRCPLTGLPPAYLSIEGYKKCLATFQLSSTSQGLCLPETKPRRCRDKAWQQLQGPSFYGVKCPPSESLFIEGVGAPEYLSIVGNEECLGENQEDGYTSSCIPTVKPENCQDGVLNQLTEVPDAPPICKDNPQLTGVPPAYLGIEGHQDCLADQTSSSGGHQEVCLPTTKPENCTVGAWSDLQDKFKGEDCRPLVGGLGGRPPQFLSVEGHQECLATQKNKGGGYEEYCLPNSKPALCSPLAWKELIEGKFNGRKCRPISIIGIPAPTYTQVPGYDKCLNSKQSSIGSHFELCLPSTKPPECNKNAWTTLEKDFVGNDCDYRDQRTNNGPVLGGPSSLPPKYLSIAGHQHCLSSHKPSPQALHTEICLPNAMPVGCEVAAFNLLKEEVNGGRINKCRDQVSVLGGPSSLPPKYLSITGHQHCLSSHKPSARATHMEVCLPTAMPVGCEVSVFNLLKEEVSGGRVIECRTRAHVLGGPSSLPPKYLSITGHQSCLSSHKPSPFAIHTEICLPRVMLVGCDASAFNLLKEEVSGGRIRNCRNSVPVLGGPSSLPPKYLSINGHQDCLGTHKPSARATHMEVCLPRVMPGGCKISAFNLLKEEVSGGRINDCRNSGAVLGGPSSLPPKYLSIAGHQECLSSHKPSTQDSHMEVCLPRVMPDGCEVSAFNLLEEEVNGGRINQCKDIVQLLGGPSSLPPKYLSIAGHHKCLSSHSPRSGATHTEVCLPGAKPEDCDPAAWTALQNEVTAQKINRCRPNQIVGGPNTLPPKYLSIAGHPDCLSDHSPSARSSHREICLPSTKPNACNAVAWDKLKDEVNEGNIKQCGDIGPILGGQGGLPPSYLGIDGHRRCLRSHSSVPGDSHKEVCLPKRKPILCASETWQKLEKEFDQGNIKQCRLPLIGFPNKPILGRRKKALPPKYLQVDGYRHCTRGFEASDSHTEHCLPLTKPQQPCTHQAYKQLLQIAFEVEQPRASLPIMLDAQPPEYLFVAGHEKCLDEHNAGDHREKCMPSVRPNECDSSTWIQLQNVFDGASCRACQKFCTFEFAPICGSDDITYPNKCTLEYTACKEDKILTVQRLGKCCPDECTFDSSKVCGTDGKTYPNKCTLEQVICRNNQTTHDLKIAYEGECRGIVGAEESSPFAAVTNCEPTNDDCSFKYNGKQAFCHKVATLGVDGICVPRRQFCTTKNDCPNIGNLQSGLYSASCSPQGLCAYERFPILA